MAQSINGWDVLDNPEWGDPRLEKKPIPGVPTRSLWMRREVLPLFLAFASEYHQKIAPLDEGELDDWSYDYRPARQSSSWSDHSSGTAIDLNSSKEGALGYGPLAWWQKAGRARKARELKAKYEVLMWGGAKECGGDYFLANDTDWMHWALRPGVTLSDVQRVIKKLGIQPDGTIKDPSKPDKPTPKPPTPKPPTPQPPSGQPPVGKGPEWLVKFLDYVGCPAHMKRAWWTIGMRESGGNPACQYPAGAPFGDWARDTAPYFDTGLFQINNRHLYAVRKMFGRNSTMELMLDPVKCWHYAQTLNWKDWGLVIAEDGQSYRFDWSGYPADWVAQYAAASEAGFKQWWDAYPKYAGQPNKPGKPSVPLPSVRVADVQPGKSNNFVLLVQKALVAAGIPLDYSSGPGTFGPRTQEAYRQWEQQCGASKPNGTPGKPSLTALAETTRLFTVVG